MRSIIAVVLFVSQFIVPITPPAATPFAGSDTFSSSPIDQTNYTLINREGDLSNAEVVCHKPSNVAISGGELILTIKDDTNVSCSGHTYQLSGSMAQWASYNFKYGTVEFRAKFAGGSGTWPAIWLLGSNCQSTNPTTADNTGACNWPSAGSDEIDIAEFPGSDRTQVNQQIHSGANNGGCTPSLTDASANYHVYQLVWAAGDLVWKIDGTQTCHVTTGVPSNNMFLIFDVTSTGNTASLPQTINVDYVTITP